MVRLCRRGLPPIKKSCLSHMTGKQLASEVRETGRIQVKLAGPEWKPIGIHVGVGAASVRFASQTHGLAFLGCSVASGKIYIHLGSNGSILGTQKPKKTA